MSTETDHDAGDGGRTLRDLLKAYWNIAYGFGVASDRAAYARNTGDELDAIHAEILERFDVRVEHAGAE